MMKSDFNFERFDSETYLITNYAGRYCFLSNEEFHDYCNGKIPETKQDELEQNYFLTNGNIERYIRHYSNAIREYRNYLFAGTGLHIFVLTNQCNLSCVYCQASTQQNGKLMTKEIAEKSVNLALQSPKAHLAFEFQGGEPLINFDVLKHIVLYSKEKSNGHRISYNLVSNLSLLSDEIIDFLAEHDISVSTSLDGDEKIQNINRPYIGENSFYIWSQQYEKLRSKIKCDIGGIQTTTRYALDKYKETVDIYVKYGFSRIFLRPLTPLGYAATRWDKIGYTPEEYLVFYEKALDYIIELSKKGIAISEGHASIFLDKIFNHHAGNYTELTSPCGAALGQLAYNYDGKIYTCDEGRMLAEMGDSTFQLGTVDSQYSDLFNNSVCKAVANASCLEGLHQCAECAYSPYCGTCPVLTYYENKSIFSSQPNQYKCKLYRGMLKLLFEKIKNGTEEEISILKKWVS